MAASQLQREQQQQKEKKQTVRLHDDTLPLEDVSQQGSTSELPMSSSEAASASPTKASQYRGRPKAADQAPSSYPATAAYSYYYPGFSGAVGDYYNQGYYVAGNGMDTQYPVAQADNGSFVYVMPNVYGGYEPYTQYMPYSTVGVDGQYVTQQVYPSSPVFQSPILSSDLTFGSIPSGDLAHQTPYVWGSSLVGDGAYGNGYVGVLENPPTKPNTSTAVNPTVLSSKPSKVSDTTNLALEVISGNNKKLKPFNKGSSDLPAQSYYTVPKYPIYNNQGKTGFIYSNNSANSKLNAKGWGGLEKSKTKSKVSPIDDAKLVDGKSNISLTTNANSAIGSAGGAAESSAYDEIASGISLTSSIRRDQYNLPDFCTKYDQAFFYVIKSYSEDDIHKSIKYNVWASTPNGNKRLSGAYQEAQNKMAEIGTKCPVFLFFSVNASGQFCGVAEMIGQVDFNKSMDFWQQSKWNGYFPVKWHIIKDIPNAQLRHIILQNNENKPVTNSRDTQEVKVHQGTEMLNIFKNYSSATSILDDFDFYENRQKIMQEKRLRQSVNHLDLQVKVDELTTGFQAVDLSAVKNT